MLLTDNIFFLERTTNGNDTKITFNYFLQKKVKRGANILKINISSQFNRNLTHSDISQRNGLL